MAIDKIDFAFYLLVEWVQNTLDAFISQVGSQEAIEIMRPYFRFVGASLITWSTQELHIEGSDIEKIVTVMQEANLNMRKELGPYEITSFGARCDITNCNLKDSVPELCELICVIAGNGLCEGFSTDYRFIIPMKMTVGAPHCRWIITKKSIDGKHEGYKDQAISIVPRKQFDKAWRDTFGRAAFVAIWIQQILAFIETFGPERALEILSPCMRSSGLSAGTRIIHLLELGDKNAITISAVLDFINEGLSQKGTVTLHESETIIKEIVDCPLAGSPTEIEVCQLFEKFTNGICEVINPNYELFHTKAMCRGDKTCVRVIRRKMIGLDDDAKQNTLS